MTCYFRKPDIIAVELFFSKIIKYRFYNMDSSFVGVAHRRKDGEIIKNNDERKVQHATSLF